MMQIFWRLILAHFLTDFTLQTNFIARWKRKSILGDIIHTLLFFICGGILNFNVLGKTLYTFHSLQFNGWFLLGFVTLLHLAEDEWRVRTVNKFPRSDSFFFFLYDQFVHLSLIFIVFPPELGLQQENWVLLAILFIMVTHFSSIVIYFIEKDIRGSSAVPGGQKYLSMLERLATASLLLIPGWWFLIGLAIWLAFLISQRSARSKNVSGLSLTTGTLLALLFGLCARYICYSYFLTSSTF
jgi:hypothetical protein